MTESNWIKDGNRRDTPSWIKIQIKIKPAVYSRKSTPPQDREYTIVGDNGAVGNLAEIREYIFSKYGNRAILIGNTLEGIEIKEEFI